MASHNTNGRVCSVTPTKGRRHFPRRAHTRTDSNESIKSWESFSSGSGADEHFPFSPGNTPIKGRVPMASLFGETAAGFSSIESSLAAALAAQSFSDKSKNKGPDTSSNDPFQANRSDPDNGLSRSKPIDIEMPAFRRASGGVETPIEPLSARGDIPGAYFPRHEDPESRIRKLHPFEQESFASPVPDPQKDLVMDSTGAFQQLEPSEFNFNDEPMTGVESFPFSAPVATGTMDDTSTPLSSYLPTGTHENSGLPLGKYYPNNWERRQRARQMRHQMMRPGGTSQAEPQIQRPRQITHTRSGSEVQRRLIQYKLDMVTQTSILASTSTNQGSSFFDLHKPVSPRLAPLGSPGPVTPMSLEASGGDYITLGQPIAQGLDFGVSKGKEKVKHNREGLLASNAKSAISI